MIHVQKLLEALTTDNDCAALFMYTAAQPASPGVTRVDWPGDEGSDDVIRSDVGALHSKLARVGKQFKLIILGEAASASEKLRALGMCFRAGVVAQNYTICAIHERSASGVLAPPENAANTFVFSLKLNYKECSSTLLQSSGGWVSLHSAQKPPAVKAAVSHLVID